MCEIWRLPRETRVKLSIFIILIIGLSLGFLLNANSNIPTPWNRISSILGWLYFTCWSVSFYPQIFLNASRKSVIGLSFDYLGLNFLGFLCYTIFNCAFYFSTKVQEEYQKTHHGQLNAVELNDVVFAIHATILIGISIYQCFIYPRGKQNISSFAMIFGIGSFILICITSIGVLWSSEGNKTFTTLNLLYVISYVKLMTTLIKCLPQVYLNYQRQSTVGWTIWNVLLDISGGILSLAQQFIDAFATSDWSAITGDPVKFGLGSVSLIIDVIFILQHYYFYAENNQVQEVAEERKALLTKYDEEYA